MCTAAEFVTAKDQKQARCLSTGGWINCGRLYRVILFMKERNELLYTATWITLIHTGMSERSKIQKSAHCMTVYTNLKNR